MLQRTLEPEVMDHAHESIAYDAMDHRASNAAFVDRLLSLGLQHRASGSTPFNALDLGTGPGHLPVALCQVVPTLNVTAIDLAQSMLDLAEQKIADANLAPRIALHLMDVKAMDLPDESFDLVYSNTILHHIPEPIDMLREARRVLKPGGLLLIRDLFRPETAEQINQLVAQHAALCDDEQRALLAQSLHAALTPDELRVLADRAGLTGVEIVVDTDRHMSLQTAAD